MDEPPGVTAARIREIHFGGDGMPEARGFLARNQVERFRRRIGASLAADPVTLPAEEHRRHVAGLFARLGELDFYELLGVGPEARDEEVHRAYVTAARLLHPEHAPRLAMAGAEAALELLFERTTEAYLTLSDPDRALRYATALGERRPPGAAGTAEREEERRREAARQFQIAHNLATDGRYHDAVQVLQQVVSLAPRSDYFALLSECLAHNPNWLPRAVEAARSAVELSPESAVLLTRLAHLHERRGDRARAMARYREALELDPTLADARAGIERLAAEAPDSRSGGLVRRLLSRLGRGPRA